MSSGIFPTQWKDCLIAPLPKVIPITGDGNLRPIALAPVISKVLEDFVVECLPEGDINIILSTGHASQLAFWYQSAGYVPPSVLLFQ